MRRKRMSYRRSAQPLRCLPALELAMLRHSPGLINIDPVFVSGTPEPTFGPSPAFARSWAQAVQHARDLVNGMRSLRRNTTLIVILNRRWCRLADVNVSRASEMLLRNLICHDRMIGSCPGRWYSNGCAVAVSVGVASASGQHLAELRPSAHSNGLAELIQPVSVSLNRSTC